MTIFHLCIKSKTKLGIDILGSLFIRFHVEFTPHSDFYDMKVNIKCDSWDEAQLFADQFMKGNEYLIDRISVD